jgi:hypothetical protein
MRFEQPFPLRPEVLTRLAPAVERPGIHLGVWPARDGLWIWGSTQTVPPFCFVLEVVAPGLLVVKHGRAEATGKFVNVAVLEGDQVKVLIQDTANLPDCPAVVSSLLGFESPESPTGAPGVLTQLAVSMRAHGRGGLLLVVPGSAETWRESVVHPMPYAVSPPFAELADLIRDGPGDTRPRRWQEAVRRAVDAIAGLTAVDGATVITGEYELLAFGAKIVRRKGWPQVEQVLVTEPVEGARGRSVHPSQIGGTRHLAAAQFAQDQRDAVSLAASQDGRFTVFAWSPCEETVHAHRVEALLL